MQREKDEDKFKINRKMHSEKKIKDGIFEGEIKLPEKEKTLPLPRGHSPKPRHPVHEAGQANEARKEKTKEEKPEEENDTTSPKAAKIKIPSKVSDSYEIVSDEVPARINIEPDKDGFVNRYLVSLPKMEAGTSALLKDVEVTLVSSSGIKVEETMDRKTVDSLKVSFRKKANDLIKAELPHLDENELNILSGFIIHDMLGLGSLEILLRDDALEELVINNANEPAWVYHKKYGWLKTNVIVDTDQQIENYASLIGRRVGRQITVLNPLMDAHLVSGDRVNATLFPISSKGNTITIRKFRRKPWTITDTINNNTISPEIAAILWTAIQYEMSMLVSGGTGSGKTTMLNQLMTFVPPTNRVISIEDTRELNLPDFLHWVPMTTREPNQEGKGEITMLDLMVNSLRMRPDRIVLGETRRQREAEVLFEAMMTGHSVYSTIHANTAEQTVRRLTSPPIDLPPAMLESLDLILVMFRDRRRGIRRTFQLAEILPPDESKGGGSVRSRILYKWKPRTDRIEPYESSISLFDKLGMHTGLSHDEIIKDLQEKEEVLKWAVKQKANTVNGIGRIVSSYYAQGSNLLKKIEAGKDLKDIFPENCAEMHTEEVS